MTKTWSNYYAWIFSDNITCFKSGLQAWLDSGKPV